MSRPERASAAWALAGGAGFVLIWALSASWMARAHVFPGPLLVAVTAWEWRGDLLDSSGRSAFRVGVGWLGAGVLAVPIGWAAGAVPVLDAELRRFTALLRSVPPFAWLPLLLLWVGIGDTTSILVCGLGAFFPILEGARSGSAAAPPSLLQAARNLGATPIRVLLSVRIPAALPSTFTGLRTGATFAWMSLVAAELVGADRGLGQLILDARNLARPDLAIAGMLCIGGVAWAVSAALHQLERSARRWGVA